jgi:hypothetical protein
MSAAAPRIPPIVLAAVAAVGGVILGTAGALLITVGQTEDTIANQAPPAAQPLRTGAARDELPRLDDVPAGWTQRGVQPTTPPPSARESLVGTVGRFAGTSTFEAVVTTVTMFETVEAAHAQFARRAGEAALAHVTSESAVGVEAIAWSPETEERELLVRDANVVWDLSQIRGPETRGWTVELEELARAVTMR